MKLISLMVKVWKELKEECRDDTEAKMLLLLQIITAGCIILGGSVILYFLWLKPIAILFILLLMLSGFACVLLYRGFILWRQGTKSE